MTETSSPSSSASLDQPGPGNAGPQDATLSDPTDVGVTTPAPPDSHSSNDAQPGDTLGGPPGADALTKDPSDWVSGDDPITPAQRSYLDTLARQAGEELPADMSKAQASQHIERLKKQLDL